MSHTEREHGYGDEEYRKAVNTPAETRRDRNGALTIEQMRDVLRAEVICCEDKLHSQVFNACGCDLMSDVLAFTTPGAVLLTGLTNPQVVRTAEILDLKAVVFVRNKRPDAETVKLASQLGIPLLSSPYPLYESCGLLYEIGLKGCMGDGKRS